MHPPPSQVDALQLLHMQHNLQLQMSCSAAGTDADATAAATAEAGAAGVAGAAAEVAAEAALEVAAEVVLEVALPSAESLQRDAAQLRAQMVGERHSP